MKKILSINVGSKGFRQEFDEACTNLGIESTFIRSRDCIFALDNGKTTLFYKNTPLTPEEYSYVFVRVAGQFSLMTSLIFQFFNYHKVALSDLSYLQHHKNEEKITQMLQFTLNNIPIPKTLLFTIDGYIDSKETVLKNISFPCVLKTNGSQGRCVWKIENSDQLDTKVAELDKVHEVAMIQELIPNTFDIRALYIHGEVIGAISRSAADGFLNNVAAGGRTEKIELTSAEEELAIKATTVMGFSFAGADIVRTPTGPLIFEVNLGPQIYGFEAATDINVPAQLLQRIKRDYL